MRFLRQSTAATVKLGPFLDSTDGATAETGLTITQADIRISKAGGAFAPTSSATGATHDENGYYGVPLDATDTNTVGRLRVTVAESGALPVWEDFSVLSAGVYDWLFGTVAPLTPTVAGRTLDVTAGGNAGIDWANVENPGSTVALAATTISTGQAVASVTGNVGGIVSVTFPTNFGLLSINGSGHISRVAVVDSVTGSVGSISGITFPSNFSALLINASGHISRVVLVDTVTSGGGLDAAGVRAALGLALANLDTQFDGIDTALAGLEDAADVAAAVRAELTVELARIDASVSQAATPAQVATEIADALTVDTYAELASVPAATSSLKDKLTWLFMMARNKLTQTSGAATLRNDADSANVATAPTSDDGTTFTRGEWS